MSDQPAAHADALRTLSTLAQLARPARIGLELGPDATRAVPRMLLNCSIVLGIGVPPTPVAFAATTMRYMFEVRVPVEADGLGVGELAAIWVFGLIGVGSTEAFTVGLVAHLIPMLAVSPGLLFLLQWRATGRDLEPRRS